MAGGGVSAFVEGAQELLQTPVWWEDWVEGGCDPTRPFCTSPTALGYVGKERVLMSLRAEGLVSSVCCGLSWWMPLSLSASPRGRDFVCFSGSSPALGRWLRSSYAGM